MPNGNASVNPLAGGQEAPQGGWLNFPVSPLATVLLSKILRVKTAPATIAHKGSTPRFIPSEVYGCHLALKMGTSRLTEADTGVYDFRL